VGNHSNKDVSKKTNISTDIHLTINTAVFSNLSNPHQIDVYLVQDIEVHPCLSIRKYHHQLLEMNLSSFDLVKNSISSSSMDQIISSKKNSMEKLSTETLPVMQNSIFIVHLSMMYGSKKVA
jgi:hypothetical protein